MKWRFIILFCLILTNKAFSQCDITAFANASSLNCGDSLFIEFTAYGSLSLSDTFATNGPTDTGWISTSGAQYDEPYIPSPTNDDYFWMGPSAVTPTALTTISYDVSGGGQICFDFVYADGVSGSYANGTKPEQPDQYNEGITLQYNLGSGWVDIIYYPPTGGTLPSTPTSITPNTNGPGAYESWTSVCVPIPPAAMTTSTSFQWIQENNSGACCDHWGLDNITISTANPAYNIYSIESNQNLGPSPATYVTVPTTDSTYNFFYTAGFADTCYTSYSVTVNKTNIGPDLILDCNDNIVQLQALGVSANDNFSWTPITGLSNPNILNPKASPLDTTEYIFTSSCGADTMTVNVISNYSFGTSKDTTICIGDSAFLEVWGGAENIAWKPNNGSISDTTIANPIFTPTTTTNYIVVTDSVGCIKTDTIKVNVSRKTITLLNFHGAGCLGANNGGFIALPGGYIPLPGGGQGGFYYTWDNGSTITTHTNGAFNNLAPGDYVLTMYDSSYCPLDTLITITGGLSIGIDSVYSVNPFCVGDTSGRIEVYIDTNVVANYSLNGGTSQTSNVFTGLTDGVYNISAQFGSCPAATRIDTLSAPATIQAVFIDSANLTCGGSADGEISISAVQGIRPYTYSLDNINFQTDSFFTGLDAGTYIIYAMDDNGCRDSVQASVSEPTPLALNNIVVNPALCSGSNSGTISFGVLNGLAPYQYSIDSGLSFQNSNTFNTLPAGNYILQAKDANGCLSNFVNDSITEPSPIVLIEDSTHSSTCGAADGALYLSAAGGNNTFTYSINGGTSFQASSTFAGLTAGLYTVIVRDGNLCSDSLNVTIANFGGPSLSIASFDSVSCGGAADASVTLLATGGQAPYSYTVNGGTAQNSATFTGLSGGNNVFVVSDAIGNCTATVIQNIYEPTTLTLSAVQDGVSCHSFADGQITLTATGGGSTYFYALNDTNTIQLSNVFNGLSAGANTAYVVDENGCFASVAQTVFEPDTLIITNVNPVDISCTADGSFTVNAQGGTQPYTYSINGGTPQTSNVFTLNTGGTYTLSVTDVNACPLATKIDSLTAADPVTFVIDSVTASLLCNNQNTGFIGISATGGSGSYTYSLNNAAFQIDSFFSNLAAGTYSIVVQDASNCVSSATNITINQPNILAGTKTSTSVSCFGSTDGSIVINSVSGGTAPYSVEINGVVNTYSANMVFDNLAAGAYAILITDTNGCSLTLNETVANVTAFSLNSNAATNVSCFGAADGKISISATGGTPNYDFTITLGAFTQTVNSASGATFSNLEGTESGLTYTISVEDANGCSASLTQTIKQPKELIIEKINTSPISCFGVNDASLSVEISGGSAPYTYLWTPSEQTSALASGLAPGVYSVAVTDANNCTVTASQTVLDVAPILATIVPDSANISMGDTLHLGVNVENAVGTSLQYTWTPSEGLSCTDCSNPVVTVFNDIVYSVLVTDENGCTSFNFAQAYVSVDGSLFYFIPNAFSPNADGINDVFQIFGQDIKSVDLKIFNRWGEKVFEGQNQFLTWNGSYQGSAQNPGVYSYIVKITFLNDAEVIKKGSVTLLK